MKQHNTSTTERKESKQNLSTATPFCCYS